MADHDIPDSALQLYTAEQAAQLLQVSPSWLRRKAAARTVACTFIGKHLRFSTSDLKSIIASGATNTGSHQRKR